MAESRCQVKRECRAGIGRCQLALPACAGAGEDAREVASAVMPASVLEGSPTVARRRPPSCTPEDAVPSSGRDASARCLAKGRSLRAAVALGLLAGALAAVPAGAGRTQDPDARAEQARAIRPLSRAELLPALTRALDALLALEREGGGWTYEQGEGRRPQGSTLALRSAERIAGTFGLATWDLVVIRSPGTPAAALALLGGHRLTGREDYLAAARRAGDLMVEVQLRSGGWFAEAPVEGTTAAAWFRTIFERSALDDDVTPGAIRLLLALWEATGERRYWYAATRGVEFLKNAQLPSGAWPLVWRPGWKRAVVETFEDLPTLNDGATSQVVETLALAAKILERADVLRAARRGGDWLADARLPPPHAGWAQQYDTAGRPAGARRFEPPALAAWESRYAIEALIALAAATDDQRYCAPVADAVAWLARAAIAPRCWARLYDLETGAPLYVDDDGERVASPAEAHQPYDWRGEFGIPALLARLGVEESEGLKTSDGRARGAPAGGSYLPAGTRPVAGDPGSCPHPERKPVDPRAFDPRKIKDPRILAAYAGRLLAALEPPPPSPCRHLAAGARH
jgi:hypothetical protein